MKYMRAGIAFAFVFGVAALADPPADPTTSPESRRFQLNEVVACKQGGTVAALDSKEGTVFQAGEMSVYGKVKKADDEEIIGKDPAYCRVIYCEIKGASKQVILEDDLANGLFRDNKFYVSGLQPHQLVLNSLAGCPKSDSKEVQGCLTKQKSENGNLSICQTVEKVECIDDRQAFPFTPKKLSKIFGSYFSCGLPEKSILLSDILRSLPQIPGAKVDPGKVIEDKFEGPVRDWSSLSSSERSMAGGGMGGGMMGGFNSTATPTMTPEQLEAYRQSVTETIRKLGGAPVSPPPR